MLSFAVVGATVAAKARAALVKGQLITGAAAAVAVLRGWRLGHKETPLFETMGVALANLACGC